MSHDDGRDDDRWTMGRRRFLGVLGGSGLALLGESWLSPLWAQGGGGSVPGVDPDEVAIGMSAAFHGSAAGLGHEYYRGAEAAYREINSLGGVNGRQVRVIALDDGYEPLPTIKNTIRLVEQERVFCLSNYVGTPTLTRALPVIKSYEDQHLVLIGCFTGAQPQREPPYAAQVFNVRASYRQEMMALVERFWAAGVRRFGVYYQIDAYGRSGTDGVARGLARYGAEIVAEATYRRGAAFETDMALAAGHLRDAGCEVVLATGAYQGCAAFVRSARDLGWNVPIANVSFVGCEAMLELLIRHGREKGTDYTRRLVNSQVVPSYDDVGLPGVVEYRRLMDKWNPGAPAELAESSYRPQRYSFGGLEGFINAQVILEGLRRAGPELDRPGFKAALESIADLDLGIGAPIRFGPDRHQGLDQVYFTTVNDDRWVPLTDFSSVASG